MKQWRVSIAYYLNLLRLSLLYQVKEFFQTSTLHGVKYIAESNRPFAERFMWFIFTSTGLVSALVIIASLWEKFQTNPTITGLDTNFQSSQMTFPTVLVCPSEPFNDEAITQVAYEKLSGQNSDLSVDLEDILRELMTLSLKNLKYFYDTVKNVTKIHPNVSLNQHNLRELMFLVGVKCADVFEFCSFKDLDFDCCDSFGAVFTEMGFCFGINLLYKRSLESDGKYLERNTNQLHLLESDKKSSLLIYPKLTSKIYIHSPWEVPSVEMAYPTISWNTDSSIDVVVNMKETITTDDTKQLSVGWVN